MELVKADGARGSVGWEGTGVLAVSAGPGGLEVSVASVGSVGADDPDVLGGSVGAGGFGVRGGCEEVSAEEGAEVGVEWMSPVRLLGSLCGFMARRSRGRPLRRDPCG
ncbi:hypothetical protein San01_59480 [Streptomyces angustmyceticus]|uniref:Uncharacterized protein n=1 Tax=Streptomyces angustmyceticus TaxID=285578 RepID=A0A5J4LPD7_9ACTN|nr:hypothetical protein San01_59480 [Streptomyces angustmyceticus]